MDKDSKIDQYYHVNFHRTKNKCISKKQEGYETVLWLQFTTYLTYEVVMTTIWVGIQLV